MAKTIIKCALLSSFTADSLTAIVDRQLADSEISIVWWVAPFGQYRQVLLDPAHAISTDPPHLIFIAVDFDDITPPHSEGSPEEHFDAVRVQVDGITNMVRDAASRLPGTTFVINSFAASSHGQYGFERYKTPASPLSERMRANLAIATLGIECSNVIPIDLDAELGRVGTLATQDPRFYYAAGMRLGREGINALADVYSRVIRASLGLRKKCIVLDLDGTLWGGIVGEDGPENIILGTDGAGKAFQDFQRALKELSSSGVLLTVVSKNFEAVALSAIREHPAMILGEEDFAAIRINWSDKAGNIASIAEELSLGLNSFVFFDDSPHERELVRSTLPEVAVPELPEDASYYTNFLHRLNYFDTLNVTEEDRVRTNLYADERERRQEQTASQSVESFLQSLGTRVQLRLAVEHDFDRVAQLTQRTNQFNLSTRRYSRSEISELSSSDDAAVVLISAKDRIGSAGTVGVAIIRLDTNEQRAVLDTLLMSCRVLGRGIETAFMSGIAAVLGKCQIKKITAEFIPTERNAMASQYLPDHGFESVNGLWVATLGRLADQTPDWIELTVEEITC